MADVLAFALRFLHILAGIAWIGAVAFSLGVVRRAMGRVDLDARRRTMRQLIPVAIRYVPMAAVSTIVLGVLLYLHMGRFDAFLLTGTPWGRLILAALVFSLAAFALGMVLVVGTGRRILTHLDEPACEHGPEMGVLQKRFNLGQVLALALGLVVVALMIEAAHGYLS